MFPEMFNDGWNEHFRVIKQIDDLTFHYANGLRPDVDEWLKNGCVHEHTTIGFNDGLRVKLKFTKPDGAVEFKLRFDQIEQCRRNTDPEHSEHD